jgi:hypothetical protein
MDDPRPIAYVLLDQPSWPGPDALAKALSSRHPDVPFQKPTEGPPFVFPFAGEVAVVMAIDQPIPAAPEIWDRAAFTWPQAREAASRHRAHLIVSMMGDVSFQTVRAVTALTGALLDAAPGATAVVWGSILARSAAYWREQSRAAYAQYPNYPNLLWLDILPVPIGEGTGAITVGLERFIEREIEFHAGRLRQGEVIEKVSGLATYLIEHGSVIKDGDTIGESRDERILVRHRYSEVYSGVPVLRVTPA